MGVTLISIDGNGNEVAGSSATGPVSKNTISADGRYAVFVSNSPDLSNADGNGTTDVYLRDTLLGTTTLISSTPSGASGDAASLNPAISADGRYVVFASAADDLVAGDTNGRSDVFVRDTIQGTTVRVSGDQLFDFLNPSISADGRYVSYDAAGQIYVVDLNSQTSTAIPGSKGVLSADGQHVARLSSYSNDSSPTLNIENLETGTSLVVTNEPVVNGGLLSATTPQGTVAFSYLISYSESARLASDVLVVPNGVPRVLPAFQAAQYIASDSELHILFDDNNEHLDFRFDAFTDSPGNFSNGQITTYDASTGAVLSKETLPFHFISQGSRVLKTNVSLSADGRHVVFDSMADKIVAHDTNGVSDIFMQDVATGATKLISVALDGAADGASFNPVVSADGRYVVFESTADNLVSGDTNGFRDIFVRDTIAGTTDLVSIGSAGAANGASFTPSISADGRTISFYSDATNLVSDDTNASRDVFMADNPLWASPSAPTITSNGGGATANVVIAENTTAVTTVTAVQSDEAQSIHYSIVAADEGGGADGAQFTIDSSTGTLSFVGSHDYENPTDVGHNNVYDVTVRASNGQGEADTQNIAVTVADVDETGSSVHRASLSSVGLGGDAASGFQTGGQHILSSNGRYVVYASFSDNIVDGDANKSADVFVRDTLTGTTTLVSQNTASEQGNADSLSASISVDGRYVVFQSDANNLVAGDTNNAADIFVRDLQTGTTTLVSAGIGGAPADGDSLNPSISADGRYVTFQSFADNLTSGDQNGKEDVFVRDLQTGSTTLVSTGDDGVANGDSFRPTISANGQTIAFESNATNLTPDGSTGLFEYNLANQTTTKIASSSLGSSGSAMLTVSALSQISPLLEFAVSTNPSERLASDILYVNPDTHNTSIIPSFQTAQYAVSSHHISMVIDNDNEQPVLLLDLTSYAQDQFVGQLTTIDPTTQTSQMRSVVATLSSDQTNSLGAAAPALSADGRYVAFASSSDSLVSGDTNHASDVFLFDATTGTTTLVSQGAFGQGNQGSSSPAISDDGRYVVFESSADNLVLGDTNGVSDIFVRDIVTGTTALISKSAQGQADLGSFTPSISPDGKTISFLSDATNLVSNDSNGTRDVFVVDNPLYIAPNSPPVITSNGGEPLAAISISENTVTVTTIEASDPDAGQTITFSIVGGDDADLFDIDGSSGALSFKSAPNFEAPADLGRNNIYDVVVQANDGNGGIASQTIEVTVANVDEPATIAGSSHGAVTEDGVLKAGGTLTVTDPDAGQSQFQVPHNLTTAYGHFSFDQFTGQWSYTLNNSSSAVQALNSADVRTDNLTITSLDGSASTTLAVTIHGSDEVITGRAGQLVIEGTPWNDIITAGKTNLVIKAGAGDDVIKLAKGNILQAHLIDGGSGNDTLDLSGIGSKVSVDLAHGIATGSQIGLNALQSIENIVGGSGSDVLIGDAKGNTLIGGAGNDKISGGAGNDILIGGAGNDTLTGGSAADIFVFQPGFGKDVITDFQTGTSGTHDTLDLTELAFTSIADVLMHTDGGASAVIHAGTDTITLQGVSKAQLQSHSWDLLV
jgi:VCBS repeat-containing protein